MMGQIMVGKRFKITISGKGNVTSFLSKLAVSGAKVIQLSYLNEVAHFHTDSKGVKTIRKYRRQYGVKAKIIEMTGNQDASSIISSYHFLLACLIPFVASLFLWSVEVESTMPEVSERIEVKLEKASILPFKPRLLIPDESEIRQLLMLDDPSLSWVRFKRVGSKLTVIPMLSPVLNEATVGKSKPSNLVAKTSGVLTRFELTRGERVGRIHQTVKKGDLLATGILEQGDKTTVVGAEGAVFANYWVEYSFSMPKKIIYQLQGDEIIDIKFHPPWKKNEANFKGENALANWQFFSRNRYTQEVAGEFELTEETEETVLVPLLKNKLLAETFSNAVIMDENVLHVTFDNDKVKGTILFLINDNIAVKKPISQGD
jgi:similar to stage IV sporulation protein